MGIAFYLQPFFSAFLASVVIIFLLRDFRKRCRRDDLQQGRRKGISRLGGVALIGSFLVALLINDRLVFTTSWWGVIAVSVLVLGIGLWDDIRDLSWQTQLFAQFLVAGTALSFGIRILSLTNPFGGAVFFDSGWLVPAGFVLTVVWIVAVMNAVNWADGVDGLCGGVSFIGFVTVFLLSLRPEVNQPPVAILSLTLAGSSLGFLLFNFHPAKIFAGTSGSWFLGSMLAILAIFAGTKIATALLILSLPLLDAAWVIFDRWRSGASVFVADRRRHLHHRLLSLGWSPSRIAVFFYAITASVAAVALNTRTLGKSITIAIVATITFVSFVWLRKKVDVEMI